MTVNPRAHIHGAGCTIGEVIDAAVAAVPTPTGGGGYVPVPGNPTIFQRFTYTDDGSSNGNHTEEITLWSAADHTYKFWRVTVESIALFPGSPSDYIADVRTMMFGPGFIAYTGPSTVSMQFSDGPSNDATCSLFISADETGATIDITGMSTGIAMDVVIELQATPLAPSVRPTTATGL